MVCVDIALGSCWVAQAMGVSNLGAAYLIGLLLLVLITVVLMAAIEYGSDSGENLAGLNVLLPAVVGLVFITLMGYWEYWVTVIVFFFLLVVLLRPYGGGQ